MIYIYFCNMKYIYRGLWLEKLYFLCLSQHDLSIWLPAENQHCYISMVSQNILLYKYTFQIQCYGFGARKKTVSGSQIQMRLSTYESKIKQLFFPLLYFLNFSFLGGQYMKQRDINTYNHFYRQIKRFSCMESEKIYHIYFWYVVWSG